MDALDWEEKAIQAMRDEIEHLLAEALRLAHDGSAQTRRIQQAHEDAIAITRIAHDEQIRGLEFKAQSRDLFGQAKGIIMATLHCDADTAFDLIRQQSQVENRKAIEIASEIVTRVSRRATPLNGVPSASSTEE